MNFNDNELRLALKAVNSKKSFQTFIMEVSRQHAILKKHFVFKFHDDDFGDVYQFDFYSDPVGQLKVKFELLGFILSIDDSDEIKTLLKTLKWYVVDKSRTSLDQLIEEASWGQGISRDQHDVNNFTKFEKMEWDNFVKYFL